MLICMHAKRTAKIGREIEKLAYLPERNPVVYTAFETAPILGG